jgi:hypothetical protein
MYRGWTQAGYLNKRHNINQKDERTLDDRGKDRGTNLILRIKEQETRLILPEHGDDDEENVLVLTKIVFYYLLYKTEQDVFPKY